jgi:hypothetical protein
MPTRKPKPKKPARKGTKRKPGAQPNNKNAEKHGFYSRQFSKDETNRLDLQDSMDVVAEINLLRVYVDRIAEHLQLKDKPTEDDLKTLNTLSLITQSISTLTRTHYLVRGRSGDVQDSIMQALEEIRIEMGL